MILINQAKIKINKGNLSYYLKISPNIKIGDILIIDISSLSNGSNVIIKAICDICGKEISISYKLYNKRTKNNDKFACSKKCSSVRNSEKLIKKYGVNNISQVPHVKEKIKKTNLEKYGCEYFIGSDIAISKRKDIFIEKYGVDNPQKSDFVKEKTKITNLEKYGVEYILQSNEIRERIKITNLEKYGNETPSKSKEIKDKIKSTNQIKYGGNSPMCNDEIKQKSKETLILNYGVDNPQKNKSINRKTKNTNLEKYGCEYPTQCDSVIEKRRDNNILKWGKPHVSQSEDFRKGLMIGSNEFYIKYLKDKISIFKCDCGKDHNFEIHSDNFYSRIKNKIPLCTVCYPINEHKSIKEKELLLFIKSIYQHDIIESHRDGLEIDIYLPELKLGFEFNGLYFHSDKFKEKNYHLNKTNYFKEKGIKIIHIWEDDWVCKKDIIKSQIKNWLGLTDNKIFARKCEIKEIKDLNASSVFLEKNHIQGKVRSSIKLGIYYNDILVSVMIFDKFEGRKKLEEREWNLSRFCNELNTNVIGGASKLLKYFIKKYNPMKIISYADKSWSNGNLYDMLNFKITHETKPDYKYIIDNKRIHKSRFKKSNLNINELITENEYMHNIGIEKIYDCGKIKYEMKL